MLIQLPAHQQGTVDAVDPKQVVAITTDGERSKVWLRNDPDPIDALLASAVEAEAWAREVMRLVNQGCIVFTETTTRAGI